MTLLTIIIISRIKYKITYYEIPRPRLQGDIGLGVGLGLYEPGIQIMN